VDRSPLGVRGYFQETTELMHALTHTRDPNSDPDVWVFSFQEPFRQAPATVDDREMHLAACASESHNDVVTT
jgi:hypothetical protein